MDYNNKSVLILGGTSDVAKVFARQMASLGCDLILTCRDIHSLYEFKTDLEIRYSIRCAILHLDILNFDSHDDFCNQINKVPDIVISFIGYLDNQMKSEAYFPEALRSINTNYTGLVSLLNIISRRLEKRGSGMIIGVSSVAGDRGRAKNYIYGSSKAAFTTFLSGLRNRLNNSGVRVVTVKPGFIISKMSAHIDYPKFIASLPSQVSRDIIKAIDSNREVVYSGFYWRYIMLIIKLIPEKLFKKLSI